MQRLLPFGQSGLGRPFVCRLFPSLAAHPPSHPPHPIPIHGILLNGSRWSRAPIPPIPPRAPIPPILPGLPVPPARSPLSIVRRGSVGSEGRWGHSPPRPGRSRFSWPGPAFRCWPPANTRIRAPFHLLTSSAEGRPRRPCPSRPLPIAPPSASSAHPPLVPPCSAERGSVGPFASPEDRWGHSPPRPGPALVPHSPPRPGPALVPPFPALVPPCPVWPRSGPAPLSRCSRAPTPLSFLPGLAPSFTSSAQQRGILGPSTGILRKGARCTASTDGRPQRCPLVVLQAGGPYCLRAVKNSRIMTALFFLKPGGITRYYLSARAGLITPAGALIFSWGRNLILIPPREIVSRWLKNASQD